MSSTHSVDGSTLTLLRTGEEYFPRLLAAIDSARHSIYLETYIYAADATGRKVSDALLRAARRGVAVHVMLDGYGSADLPQSWLDEWHAANVALLWFRRKSKSFELRRYHLRRLHRKLVVVDKHIAFIGGINIIDDQPDLPDAAPRLDYAVEIHGASVVPIKAAMRRLWHLVAWSLFRRRREHVRSPRSQHQAAQEKITLLLRDNVRHRHDIERAYLDAISGAHHEIILANAYFLPGLRFRRALSDASRRGVRVVLLLQGRVEYRLQHLATHALYSELLAAGMEIYEYRASFLHAKVAVVDSLWATVGSSNIDPFSLWLAREANLAVSDRHFAEALRNSLLQDIAQGAHQISLPLWRKRSLWERLLIRLSYAAVRFLAGITGPARGRDEV